MNNERGIWWKLTIKLMLIFLAVYVTFIAVALNYAKAFRVKNGVIDIIEQNEGIDDYSDTGSENSIIKKIDDYLLSISYYVKGIDDKKCPITEYNYIGNRGYCLNVTSNIIDNVETSYYKVTTFVKIELPFFNINMTIPITGETRKIERINRKD